MRISPLSGSLDPAGLAETLAPIPQTHIVSTRDAVVPESVVQSYVAMVTGAGGAARVLRTDAADHWCCWPEPWPDLLDRIGPPPG
jgi:hypothetical protein